MRAAWPPTRRAGVAIEPIRLRVYFTRHDGGVRIRDAEGKGRVAGACAGIPGPNRRHGGAGLCRRFSPATGLPTWDTPAVACLSSRIPHGERVAVE